LRPESLLRRRRHHLRRKAGTDGVLLQRRPARRELLFRRRGLRWLWQGTLLLQRLDLRERGRVLRLRRRLLRQRTPLLRPARLQRPRSGRRDQLLLRRHLPAFLRGGRKQLPRWHSLLRGRDLHQRQLRLQRGVGQQSSGRPLLDRPRLPDQRLRSGWQGLLHRHRQRLRQRCRLLRRELLPEVRNLFGRRRLLPTHGELVPIRREHGRDLLQLVLRYRRTVPLRGCRSSLGTASTSPRTHSEPPLSALQAARESM